MQQPYQGPFKVLERHEKYLNWDIGNRHDMASLGRIKPAFMDATDTIEPVPLVTSSGGLVRLPAASVIFFPINAPGMGRFQQLNLGVLSYGLGFG